MCYWITTGDLNAVYDKSLSGRWGKPLCFLPVFASSLVCEVKCQERMSNYAYALHLAYVFNSVFSELLDFLRGKALYSAII